MNLDFSLRISSQRFWVLVLVSIAYVVTQFTALVLIAEIYPYFEPRELLYKDHIVALVCMLAPAAWLPLRSSPSNCATWIFYTFMYTSSCIAGISLVPSWREFVPFIGFLAMGLIVFHLVGRIRFPAIAGEVRIKQLDFLLLGIVSIVVLYAWSFSNFTVSLGFADVYERRLAAREGAGVWGYLIAPLRLLVPALALYAWTVRRNPWWLIIMGVGSLAVFSYDGTKSIVLVPILMWVVIKGLRAERLPMMLMGMVIILNGVALIEHGVLGSELLAEYGIRRAFVVPGMLSYYYWDFAPHAVSLRTLTYDIGLNYFERDNINANSNLLMWGYVWARWWGGAMVAALAGVLIAQFNAYPGGRFPYLGSLMAGGCAIFWSEQFLHTSMLTGGVVYVLALTLILRLVPSGFPSLKNG